MSQEIERMTAHKALTVLTLCSVIFLGAVSTDASAAPPEVCKEPQTGTATVPLFSPPLAVVVTGVGRLQFYSAPNSRCVMNGIFVVPKDEMVSYAQTKSGWSSVMYTNPRTGSNVQGWVQSSRLKEAGTVGPQR
jgi:hypothetical protein